MIIGIGSAGLAICSALQNKVEDTFLTIDENGTFNPNPDCQKWNMEQYEQNALLPTFCLTAGEECVIVTASGGNIQGITLRLLEQIRKQTDNIVMFLIKPDTSLLSSEQALNNKIFFGIMQEIARSGGMKELCLISNYLLSKVDENINIFNYEEIINQYIVDLLLWKMSAQNEKPIKGKISNRKEHQVISNIEMTYLDTNIKINSFYLKHIKHINNYIFLNKKTSKNNINEILNIINANKAEDINSSYCILENDKNILITINYTHIVQENSGE